MRQPYSTLAAIGGFSAFAAAAAAVLAGPAYRLELLELREAFTVLRWAAYGGIGACVFSAAGLLRARPAARRRGLSLALAGLLLGAAVFWVPYSHQRQARAVPPIHDITTDTRQPPEFRAVVPLRPAGANSLAYAGDALAARQRAAYPDIGPAVFQAPADEVFGAAATAARDLDWHIIEESPTAGRLEAVDTTFWFGFRDDIVVRVAPADGGTRVDVRSVSRAGVSDVGKNAARIRAFLAALRDRM